MSHTPIESVRWSPDRDAVVIIDQRALPAQLVERRLTTTDEVVDAIRTLAVRGAPAIGIAGAMGLACVARRTAASSPAVWRHAITDAAARIRAARPTAVNLPWAIDRMLGVLDAHAATSPDVLVGRLDAEADAILAEDRAMCLAIGEHGLGLLAHGSRILTHCNAGALATGGIGTALAPVYLAAERGLAPTVHADETRPLFQGSRLTAWELQRAGIPVTVLPDGAAASLLGSGAIDLVIVGADRIAANGDVANKVGTYALALAARYHGVPFYVAAPTSTIDPATATGRDIEIEQRAQDEVRFAGDLPIAPEGVRVHNPAFDVTPAALVTAIVTDTGVHHPPFDFTEHALRTRD